MDNLNFDIPKRSGLFNETIHLLMEMTNKHVRYNKMKSEMEKKEGGNNRSKYVPHFENFNTESLLSKDKTMEKKFEWTDAWAMTFAIEFTSALPMTKEEADEFLRKFKADRSEHSQQYPKGIFSFKTNKGSISIYDDRLWQPHGGYNQWVKEQLEQSYKIHSVVNSSGETLSVGMETNYGKITCFKIFEGKILCGADGMKDFSIAPHVDEVHPDKPVFKTEDGYELKADCVDFVYTIIDWGPRRIRNFYKSDYSGTYKVFLKLENAEKFIFDNKPQFSRKDILGAAINDYKTPNQLYITVDKSKLGL